FVPELRVQAESLMAEYRHLANLSATIHLRDYGVIAINGGSVQTRALARSLLGQLVAFHSPEDVRCLLFTPWEQLQNWEWFKWLPHGRCLRRVKAENRYDPDHICMFATNVDDLRFHLQQQIQPELERRRRLKERDSRKEQATNTALLPHLVIVLDGFAPGNALGQMSELETLFNEGPAFGITVICLIDDRGLEPAQTQVRLSISRAGALNFEEIKYGGRHLEGLMPDTVEPQLCERIARSMAPLTLAEVGASQDLAQGIRLLDLLNVPAANAFDLSLSQSWYASSRQNFLRVPIGQCANGRLLTLDLKEAADGGMGPHGLIVGATGSGKSELLRTLVTALIMTHDPEVLNFVLVDFKGGASFADFGELPHVAGIVTNLQSDITLIDRVYSSILGEQQRRQRMLHEAGNLDNVKQYQTMRQKNPAMEPMPHLVIVVDEFAELIASRPDFLDLFITIGRVGRSLGVHLLFATQRLEEGRIRGLESYLRYRICLRTFSEAESNTVLGKTDAYYLPSVPGVGYFKVDTDTYDLFKTALISVPYVPLQEQNTLQSKIRIFTTGGKLVPYRSEATSARLAAYSTQQKVAEQQKEQGLRTEMDVVIERVAQVSRNVQRHAIHQVWLPPLEKSLPLRTVLKKSQGTDLDGMHWQAAPPFGELRVPAGLIDLPLQQAQEPLWLDFSGIWGHLALVGAPQSGKSTFLRSLMTAMMLTHAPGDVQFYCIDMGGGLLRVFEQAPHVGAICSKLERDKVRRVVNQMRKVINEREFLFREHGIDSMATFREMRRNGALRDVLFGDVFLVIDNFAQFFQEFDMLEPQLMELATSGLTYGVHLVVTTSRWGEIRAKLRDNIGARLELRLNDPFESELGKATATSIPVGVPGRGANSDKHHFQIALPSIQPGATYDGASIQKELSALVQRMSGAWKGEGAPPVLMLPALVNRNELPLSDKRSGVPLGLEEFRLSSYSVDLIEHGPHFLILGDTECGKTSVLRTWIRGIEQYYQPQEAVFAIVDYRKRLLDFAGSKHLLTYAYNQVTLDSCVGNIRADLERRMRKVSEVPLTEMRKPQRWNGRAYFLFVDDYETISSMGNSSLAPLADYLMMGHEIGFHLVVVRRVSGVGRAMFEPIFQNLTEMGTSGLIMSGDPSEGKILYGQAAGALP
ncbi:MAG TPA: type VII secretion protein EccCb, partial [Ktedonobacteraceae bacterium]